MTGQFKAGDRVLVNNALVADIESIDYEADRLVYVSRAGGGTDTTYAHVSNTQLELISTPGTGDETQTGTPAVTEAVEAEAPKDELTTSESL